MKPDSYSIGAKNGLLEQKHLNALGMAVWLYLWFLDKQPKNTDKVLGGRPITYEMFAQSFPETPKRTYFAWLKRVKEGGYISVLRTPRGSVITINKPKKWVNSDVQKMAHQKAQNIQSDVQNIAPVVQKMAHRSAKNGTSNIKETVRETITNNIHVEVQKNIRLVYNFYLEKFSKNPNQNKLSDQRRIKIKARLKDAGLEMIKKAIANTADSPFYRGDNDRGWQANLDFIIRSYEQVEKLSQMDEDDGLPKNTAPARSEIERVLGRGV